MSENEEKEEKKEPKFYDTFIGRVVIIVVVVIGLYYLFSPYQNCIRSGADKHRCIVATNW